MARCYACEQTATKVCGMCETPVCDNHARPVNRWHNVFHARWICDYCYSEKQKKRKYVLIPVLALCAYLIANSMKIRWGLFEPSMWEYFFALGTLGFSTIGFATAYHVVMRTGKGRLWLVRLLPVFAVWLLLYLLAYKIM